MIYSGTFKTIKTEQYNTGNSHNYYTKTYNVTIGNTGVTQQIKDSLDDNIYAANSEVVMFDPNPVIITVDRQDLQKRVIISQAAVNLVSNFNMGNNLFANNNRDIPVEITCDGNTVFFGYVDPLQFNQGYAQRWEKVQINVTDPLGALTETYIGQLQDSEQNYVQKDSIYTAFDLIDMIFNHIGVEVSYIDSLSYTSVHQRVIDALRNTNVHLWNFFGDGDDDWLTLEETLNELFKYYNLYAIYYDRKVHITGTINRNLTEIVLGSFAKAAADSSTALSTDQVYSQAMVKCEIEPLEDLIVSLDDKDNLVSPTGYERSVHYMTEYIAEGEGKTAYNAFKDMISGNGTNWEYAYTIPNYVQVLKNDAWEFKRTNNGTEDYLGIYTTDEEGNENLSLRGQLNTLTWLKNNSGAGALLGFGRGNKVNLRDNSVQGNPQITPYFVISVNGNYNNTTAGADAMGVMVNAAQPVCTYKGLSSAILSPADKTVTNYIVISGKILLNPLQKLTGPNWRTDTLKLQNTIADCLRCYEGAYWGFTNSGGLQLYTIWHHTVPNPNNDDGAYYQQEWESTPGIHGYLDNTKNQDLEFKYSTNGDEIDNISKLPIIACQLIVGDPPKEGEPDNRKYCVERLDLGEQGWGKFEWRTLAEISSLRLQPYFTLGTNPKIGDYLIGQSCEISRNVSGINGTAIPIKYEDHLAGKIEFSILGPYNSIWRHVDKSTHHRWIFWTHTDVSSEDIPILQYTSSIMISNFKIETQSDNANLSEYALKADNDLVYYSNYNKAYIEKLEETLKICTPLTMEECLEFGIKNQMSNSYIYTAGEDENGEPEPFLGFIESENNYIKPEECLVDYYYNEYNMPAKMITTKLKADAISDNCVYGQKISSIMVDNCISGLTLAGIKFRIMSYEADLKNQTVDYTFREYTPLEKQISDGPPSDE